MGRPAPYPEADPQFTPGWKIAEQKKADTEFVKRERDIEDRLAGEAFKQGQSREAQAGRERLEGIKSEFDIDEDIMKGVRAGELELPEKIQNELRKLDADRVEALKLSPEERAEFEEKYIQKRRELLRAAHPPADVGAQYAKNLRYLDPVTGFPHPEPGEGRTPVTIVDGQPVEIPALAAQREAKEKQQKAEQEQQKKAKDAWAAQQKGILAEAKTRLAAYNKDKETGDPDKTLSDFMGEVEGDYITAGIPLVRNPNAPSPTDGISLSGGGGESVTGDAGVVTPPGAPAAGAQEVTVNPDGSVDIPPAAQETPAATAPQQPGQGPQQPAATPGAPHTGQAPPGAVREIPGSNPPAWEMEDGSTVFQMHDGTRVKVVPVPERTQPGGGRAEPTPAAPAAAKGTRQSRRERYLDIQSRKPATTVGLPATPPKGKASENMIAKGHEYVQLLDSKGQPRPGKYTWRPKQPEQIRSGPVASATGKFFGGTEIPRPNTKAEFDKIPSGATFYDPAGVLRRKP